MSKLQKMLLSISVLVMLIALCTGFAYADASTTGTITGDAVNVRESASTTAKVLTQLSKGSQVSILGSSNGWYKASFNNVTGWISSQFVSVSAVASGTRIIDSNDVNVRSDASTSANILSRLDKGAVVSILGQSGSWYKIKTSGGLVGWVFGEFISNTSTQVSRGSENVVSQPAAQATTATTTGQQIAEYSKKFLGVRYVYGGSTPNGFDCSGFTSYVYKQFGISLNRVAADQANQGTKVDRANLKAGDLVFFDTDGGKNYICHVGIYIGDGKFIHASSGRSTHRVVISELEGFYANTYITAKRLAN